MRLAALASVAVAALAGCKTPAGQTTLASDEVPVNGPFTYADFVAANDKDFQYDKERTAEARAEARGDKPNFVYLRKGKTAPAAGDHPFDYLFSIYGTNNDYLVKLSEVTEWQDRKAACHQNVHFGDYAASAEIDKFGANSRYAHGMVDVAVIHVGANCSPFDDARTATPCFVKAAENYCRAVFGSPRSYRFFINMTDRTASTVSMRSPVESHAKLEKLLAQGSQVIERYLPSRKDDVYLTDEEKRALRAKITAEDAQWNAGPDHTYVVAFECAGEVTVPYKISAAAQPKDDAQASILNDGVCLLSGLAPTGPHEPFLIQRGSAAEMSVYDTKYRPMLEEYRKTTGRFVTLSDFLH